MAFPIVTSSATPINCRVSPDRLAWLNDDASNDLFDGYPGTSWDAPSYVPTPHAEAQEAGYRRGYALDWAARPASSLDSLTRLCWLLGKLEGTMHRRADDAERADYERDLEEWSARPEVKDPSEIVRSIGCIAARSEGGVR